MPEIKKDEKVSIWLKPFKALLKIDYLQVIPMLLLLLIGVVFIYGTGLQIGGTSAQIFWKKQLLWIFIGFIIWTFLAYINYRQLAHWAWLIYIVSIILLIVVLYHGTRIYGAKRWLQLFFFRFQPSEIAKLAVLITAAWLLSLRAFNINRFLNLCAILAIGFIPFILIALEPDLGSAFVLIPMLAVLVFAARLKWKYIIIGLLIGIIAILAVFPFLADYQKERILVFLDPERDPKDRGWNSLQSELAVGSGGMSGKGFMQGNQHTLGFLPQTVSNTDFIFSVIAEETGFLGAGGIVLLYGILIFSALRTAFFTEDTFGRLLAAGGASIIFTHSFINIGMSIRMMPITGLPLPLVSYGGSFIVSTMIYLGILQSVYIHQEPKTKKAKNYDAQPAQPLNII